MSRGTDGQDGASAVPLEGTVVHALSGWFVVQTSAGRLLCRPRGRLKPRGATWRDVRDDERADAAMDVVDEEDPEGAPADAEGLDGDAAATVSGGASPSGSGRSRRRDPPGAIRSHGRDREPPGGREPGGASAAEEVPGVLAGDRVLCRDLGDGEGAIESVLARGTVLARPPVANVNLVAAVVAWREPPFSPPFVDRLLIEAAANGCEAVLCLNKLDLLGGADRAQASLSVAPYARAGYSVLFVSAASGEGLEELRAALAGSLTVVAGPSGAGKSRLLGALVPGRPPLSGALSRRIGRGRHTTRHVELLSLPGGGWVADTPGFSRLALDGVAPEDLGEYFPEFAPHREACRFRGCMHDQEPGCAVRAAVAAGEVDPGRHQRYLDLLAELRQARARRY